MPNPIPELEAVSGKDLLTRPIVPLEYTIDAILPHGLFILAGSSKIGKSWLALDMSCAIVSGGSLWQYTATQGEVLYLALEDNHKRLPLVFGTDGSDFLFRFIGQHIPVTRHFAESDVVLRQFTFCKKTRFGANDVAIGLVFNQLKRFIV